MANNPLPMLLAIFALVWILVLAGAIIIFEFIVPLNTFHSSLDGVIKGVLATILVIVWIGLFVVMGNAMEKRQLRPSRLRD